ncbi:MAG TPA: hypothetical protein EYM37_08760 [Methylophaga aminisulfidivorans]|nr:hypothetical protein [Methylophaga sp.]HIM40014.1 hypothetical protein [Methylophaga aminisulfidivorans]
MLRYCTLENKNINYNLIRELILIFRHDSMDAATKRYNLIIQKII